MNTKAIEVKLKNVHKRFDKNVIVVDFSLDIKPGELICLLGPSGCGKTTILRMIAGLESVTSGDIFIDGKNVTRIPPSKRKTSMVFQSYALFPHMNVFENVAYGLKIQKKPAAEIKESVSEILSIVGLAGFETRMPNQMSGGQQQRVALARAMVSGPDVLLFDEPLSNLDAKLRRHMREEIKSLHQKTGLTSIYVTHDQSEAMAIADRIVVMNKGEIAQIGSPDDIYNHPQSKFVAEFIGDANFLSVKSSNNKGARTDVDLGEMSVEVDSRKPFEGTPLLMVRPEAVKLSTSKGLKGSIEKASYLGDHLEYVATTSVGKVFFHTENKGTPLTEGQNILLDFESDRGLYLLPKD